MIDLKSRLRNFITENFLFGDGENLEDDTSLLAEEIIDSTGVLELINYLEEEFAIKIEDEELLPENLDSISRLVSFLTQKQTIQLAK